MWDLVEAKKEMDGRDSPPEGAELVVQDFLFLRNQQAVSQGQFLRLASPRDGGELGRMWRK